MWHEARRQERLVRTRMVDGAKRAERRRKYYDSVRSDPEQFMQIHGRKMKIHLDELIARAAESSNILRKWQNDSKILIDRFDARSHLEIIPSAPTTKHKLSQEEELEEIQCDFERYRILILNEFQHFDEAEFLKQIAAKEFWNVIYSQNTGRPEVEKKKKEKRAAIGYSYGDSETVAGSSRQSDSESDEDIEEQQEYDVNFDVNTLSGERGAELSRLATNYGRLEDGFIELLKIDQKERAETEQIKEIDKTKSTLSGKYARSDRAKLKKQRALIISQVNQNEAATTALLSLIRRGRETRRRRNSSSSSNSDSGVEKVKFVTSCDDIGPVNLSNMQSSSFPLKIDSPKQSEEYQRLLDLKKQRSESPDFIPQQDSAKKMPTQDSSPQTSKSATKSSLKRDPSVSSSSSSSPDSNKKLASPLSDLHDCEPLAIRSSMSESEQERIEIENRKRRVERTKRIYKEKEKRQDSTDKSENEEDNSKNAGQLLRRRMQKKLKNQLTQLKASEKERHKRERDEQQQRDEILMDKARAIRKREREKRHELEALNSSTEREKRSSYYGSLKSRRSRSRSRSRSRDQRSHHSSVRVHSSHHHRQRSRSPRRRRSRSHERSYRRRSRS